MDKDIHSKSPDDDLVELQQYIAQLKEALADYAQRFGLTLTDNARTALNFHSAPKPRQ
ncbi:MAG: hypothetical protein GW905_13660 [Rhodobacterales bacterium]|nr:hypothetical protein [Rhodobacterales bacterium]